MNKFVKRFLGLLVVSNFFFSVTIRGNSAYRLTQDQTSKLYKNSFEIKPVLEFNYAVARYVKNAQHYCLNLVEPDSYKNVLYKKELRYLFNNYNKLSLSVLLSRLRLAHRSLVKEESNIESDDYKKYEQVSSALLLICSQIFFNKARDRILKALYEIDNIIIYWQYQQNHPMRYFFGKSPFKWISGKNQDQEIATNLIKLEQKQRELYTILGLLVSHGHFFVECVVEYDQCCDWIEKLFTIVSSVKSVDNYNLDGTRFDRIIVELEVNMQRVNVLTENYLLPVMVSKKPNHFVRNWIAYVTLVGLIGYIAHCSAKDPDLLLKTFTAVQDSTQYIFDLMVDPLKKIYKRMETAFSPKLANDAKDTISETPKKDFMDVSVDEICDEIDNLSKQTVSNISEEIAKSNTTWREDALTSLDEAVEDVKTPKDGFLYGTTYEFDENTVNEAVRKLLTIKVEPIKHNGIVINQEEVTKYENALRNVHKTLEVLAKQTPHSLTGYALWLKLQGIDLKLRGANDYLDPLQRYTDIVDTNVLKLIQLFAQLAENLARRADFLITEADLKLKEADAALQDNQLTFMFTALIPLIATCVAITKLYQWGTRKNYTPIRIVLADINSLLIESTVQLDDHGYGKLVYLICKLRSKAKFLKNPLSNEFLSDINKLESKQYTTQTKRNIIENMFNKYAFLGRIAV